MKEAIELFHLAQANRHIAEGEERIAEQKERIDLAYYSGKDTSASAELLRQMEWQMRHHKAQILEELTR